MDRKSATEKRRVKLERELAARVARAQESRRRRSLLVSSLVHQITQPLTVMEGLLECAPLLDCSTAQYRSLLKTLRREVDRLSHMVRRIREMAEIESALEDVLAVPLVQSVKRTVEQMAPSAGPKKLKIQIDAPKEILVWAGPQRLEWGVQKLVSGAVRRSPKCGKVRISISSSSVAAILTVSDQGPNVVSRDLDGLPGPPVRLRRSFTTPRKSAGDGLEWALAQWMFESSGAILAVRNRTKQGCVVTVTLPLMNKQAASDE
jgi:signal transduction histidine kinase